MRNKNKSLFGEAIGAIVIGVVLVIAMVMMIGKVKTFSKDSDVGKFEILGASYKYELADDSVRQLQNKLNHLKTKVESKKSNLFHFGGIETNGFGVFKYADSLLKNSNYFIVLSNFGLNTNPFDFEKGTQYYFENGKSYLRLPVITKVKNNSVKIRYEDKEVGYRYDYAQNKILIPLANGNEVLITKFFCYTIIGVFLFLVVFGVILFLKFLFEISRNRIFEEVNIRRLFWIAMCCFATVLIPYIILGIQYLMFFKTLSQGAVCTKVFSGKDVYFTAMGLLFLALYVAFKKGMVLKQENDLTI